VTAPAPARPRRYVQLPPWYPWVNTLIQVALVTVVVILLLQNGQLSQANQENITAQHVSSLQQCQLANETRLQDIAIWNRLLSVSPTTAAGKAEVADLKHLVKVKDTPRDCAAAYPLKK
jgi:hypothetical protein